MEAIPAKPAEAMLAAAVWVAPAVIFTDVASTSVPAPIHAEVSLSMSVSISVSPKSTPKLPPARSDDDDPQRPPGEGTVVIIDYTG